MDNHSSSPVAATGSPETVSAASMVLVNHPFEFTLAEKLVWEIVPERQIRLLQAEQVGNWFNQHTTYLIVDDRTGVEVRRRYSDFDWLRTTLEKELPMCFVPPIPAKQTFGRFDSAFIFRRQKGLQRFLNRLNENPSIRYHSAFVSFMTQTDPKGFAEEQKSHDILIKQLEKKQKTKKSGVNSSKPSDAEEQLVTHDLNSVKPTVFVTQLRSYLVKFKRNLETMNKNQTRLNEDQKSQSSFTSELGQTFESIFLLEAEAPFHSHTFMSSIERQHSDLQKLSQWNNEHISLRDESFADSLNDYTILVTEFLKFVKNFEEDELQPFNQWREAYISSRLQTLKKTFEGHASKDLVKRKLSELLAKDDVYLQVSKNFYISFDNFLTECEAVVGCLQENMSIIGEMNGHMSFSPLVTRGKTSTPGIPLRAADSEPVDSDISSTMMSLVDYVTGDQFAKSSFTFRLEPNVAHSPFASQPSPVATAAISVTSAHSEADEEPRHGGPSNMTSTTPAQSAPARDHPPHPPSSPSSSSPPAPTQLSTVTTPPDPEQASAPPPPPPPPPPQSTSLAVPVAPQQASCVPSSVPSSMVPEGARGDLLRDIQKSDQANLKKVPEEDKLRRAANFDSPTNPLEIGNLFNQITSLRTRLGYGKNSGEHPHEEENEEEADDTWKSNSKTNGKGSIKRKKTKGGS